jgi:hypothetical protein
MYIEMWYVAGLSLGYLVQTAVSGSERTCWEEASSQVLKAAYTSSLRPHTLVA